MKKPEQAALYGRYGFKAGILRPAADSHLHRIFSFVYDAIIVAYRARGCQFSRPVLKLDAAAAGDATVIGMLDFCHFGDIVGGLRDLRVRLVPGDDKLQAFRLVMDKP